VYQPAAHYFVATFLVPFPLPAFARRCYIPSISLAMATEISKVTKSEKDAHHSSSDSNEVKGQSSILQSPAMATIDDDDERLLARMGYKQVHPFDSTV
jgi:hypothetical protein